MKTVANGRFSMRKRNSFRLSEAIPFWFAVSSPVIGLVLGIFGAFLMSLVIGHAAHFRQSCEQFVAKQHRTHQLFCGRRKL